LTLLRRLNVPGLAAQPQAAVAYAVLLSVLALVAWYTGRVSGLAHAWWLPLAVIAVSEPVAARSPGHSTLRIAAVLCVTLVLVVLAGSLNSSELRIVTTGILLLAAAWQTPRHPTVLALLLAPLMVLMAGPAPGDMTLSVSLPMVLAACLPVFAASCACHFAFWTLRIAPVRLRA
jgi:hypothetical protein